MTHHGRTRRGAAGGSGAPRWFLAVAFVLTAAGVWWGMPSAFSPAVDAPGPYSPLAFIAQYGNPAMSAIYPAVHQLVLLMAYAVVFLWLLVTGGLDAGALSAAWPHGFVDPDGAFTALIVAGRVVSAAMAVGILASFWKIEFEGRTRGAALMAAVLMLGSGIFAYYSRTTNVDIPYLFWWVLSFVALWRYALGEGRTRDLVVSGVLAALAVGSKTQAAGLVLGSGLVVLLVGSRLSRWRDRIRDALLFATVLLGSYAASAILPQPARWLHHVRNYTLTNRAVADAVDQMELTFSAWSSLVHVMSLAGIALAALGIAYLARERRWRVLCLVLLPAGSYYGLIVAATGFVPARFMLPLGWLLAVPAGFAVVRTGAFLNRRNRIVWAVVVAVVLARQFATGCLPVTWSQTFTMKNRLANEMGDVVPPGSEVLWVGDRPHLPDARVYGSYRLIHEPGGTAWTKATRHAIDEAGSEEIAYVLAQEPWDSGGRAVLVRSWTYPDWVRGAVAVRSIHEYYLYEVLTPGGSPGEPARGEDQ